MSTQNDRFNRPINLEEPADLVYTHKIDSRFIAPRNKSTADRSANLEDVILMIDILLRKYETVYKNHRDDKSIILMPNLFQKPSVGTEIRNTTTKEIYSIKELIVNPRSKIWEGLVRLNAIAPPLDTLAERLEFLDPLRYVRFTEAFPAALGVEKQTGDGLSKDHGPMGPTIAYLLEKKTPGSITGTPFGDRKDSRKRIRDYIRDPLDPNHVVEIRSQFFDNLVQFDCCTSDGYSASRLARWLERFFELYEWVLRKNGLQQYMFMQYLANAPTQKWRQDLIVRSLQYYFRTEEIEAVSRRILTNIDWYVNVTDHIIDESTRFIAGQEVSGQITDQEYRDLFRDPDGNYLFGNIFINDGNL